MHAVFKILAVAALALGVNAQSSVPSTSICPTADDCGAPLCNPGGADYTNNGNNDFTCYYSPSLDVADCTYPVSTATNLFCLFANTGGALVADQNEGCCAAQAATGVRPTRRKARGLAAAPPSPGGISPAETLKKRVAYQRARDALNMH